MRWGKHGTACGLAAVNRPMRISTGEVESRSECVVKPELVTKPPFFLVAGFVDRLGKALEHLNGRTVSGSSAATILHALTCGLHRGRATMTFLKQIRAAPKVARYRRERTPMKREWPDRQWVRGIHHSPRIDMRPASRPRHHRLSKTDLAASKGGALPPGAHANEM